LTCPECGNQSKELMPTNACQFYYDCPSCGALLSPSRAIVVCFVPTETLNALRLSKDHRAVHSQVDLPNNIATQSSTNPLEPG
jgi:uncharacterized Zn finger protein